MPAAAFAKVDPRLLAENRGSNAAAIQAFGQGVVKTIDAIDEQREKEKQDEKDMKDQQWTDYLRDQQVQEAFIKHQDRKTLGYGADPGDFNPPPGYTVENNKLIRSTEAQNAADAIRNIEVDKPEGTQVEGTDVTVEDDQQPDPDNIYTGMNDQLGGGYGPGFRYRTKEEAVTAIDAGNLAQGNMPALRAGITQITSQPNFDAAANPELVSLETAIENDAVQVQYNHNRKRTEYTWQDQEGNWHQVGAKSVVNSDGAVNPKLLNGNKEVQTVYGYQNSIDFLTTNTRTKDYIKQMKSLNGLSPELKQAAQSEITTTLKEDFTNNPDRLASFVRNLPEDAEDPTPKTEWTADDAAKFTWGGMTTDDRFDTDLPTPKIDDDAVDSADKIAGFAGNFTTEAYWYGKKFGGKDITNAKLTGDKMTIYTGSKEVTVNDDNQELYPGKKIGEIVTVPTKPHTLDFNSEKGFKTALNGLGFTTQEQNTILAGLPENHFENLEAEKEQNKPKLSYDTYTPEEWNATSVSLNYGGYKVDGAVGKEAMSQQIIPLFVKGLQKKGYSERNILAKNPTLKYAFEWYQKNPGASAIPPELLTGTPEQREISFKKLTTPGTKSNTDALINKYS